MAELRILKVNEEQRMVFGLASVSVTADGETITDLQDDQIEPAELEKAFYDYSLNSGEGDVQHDGKPAARLAEMFVVTQEKLTALMKSLGFDVDLSAFKGAAAWVGYRVDDPEAWADVKAGKLKGFSIDATAVREEVA